MQLPGNGALKDELFFCTYGLRQLSPVTEQDVVVNGRTCRTNWIACVAPVADAAAARYPYDRPTCCHEEPQMFRLCDNAVTSSSDTSRDQVSS